LYCDGSGPEQPEGEWYLHVDTLIGKIKLPPKIAWPPKAKQPKCPRRPSCMRDKPESWSAADKDEVAAYRRKEARHKEAMRAFQAEWDRAILTLFEYVKQQGFPNNKDGDYEYHLPVCCWLPNDAEPADPDDFNPNAASENLLPVPSRALTDAEKMTILAAVYDAHWRGSEKVAPWGVSEDGEGPDPWPTDAERDVRRAALDYFLLFREARNLDAADLPVVRSWLEEHLEAGDPAGGRVPVCQSKKVKLFGPGEQPAVNGKRKPILTAPRYDAVQTLIEAGEPGLTKDQLDRNSGHTDARKLLKALAKDDADWAEVLLFPGTAGKGYRIR